MKAKTLRLISMEIILVSKDCNSIMTFCVGKFVFLPLASFTKLQVITKTGYPVCSIIYSCVLYTELLFISLYKKEYNHQRDTLRVFETLSESTT